MVKVRFAPSPTGIPHVGNIRTALFDYFFAKAQKGSFILRIEDTDQARKMEGAVEIIKEGLSWLGVKWDEFVVQSQRLDDYKRYANQLVSQGLAWVDDGAIRFIVPKDKGQISWTDAVGNKKVLFDSKEVEDFIILKKDQYPTYHLANVIDDHFMGITHVIRGEDWIPSTPKHILLYEAFGWETPVFAHVPNVMGTDGKKLSKRRGAKSVLDFKKEGILPEALLNYLMLLGWSPKDDREILTIDEIINAFSLENINVAPSVFDERKLLWMNGEYLRKLDVSELANRLKEYDPSVMEGLNDQEFIMFVKSAQTRIKTLAEFKPAVAKFLHAKNSGNPLLQKLATRLETVNDWNANSISSATIDFLNNENIRFPLLYESLIGEKQGLPIADVFEIFGKERTLNLLK